MLVIEYFFKVWEVNTITKQIDKWWLDEWLAMSSEVFKLAHFE